MSLNPNWYQSYDKKHKNTKSVFVQNHKRKEMEMFVVCIITFEPITSKTC